jgi:hypothetical protein
MDALLAFNIFFVIAMAVVWWLVRDVPGGRSDDEDALLRRLAMVGLPAVDAMRGGPLIAPRPPSPLAVGHRDPHFLEAVRECYERVVAAVANDDLGAVEGLLTEDVRIDFATLLAARRVRGEKATVMLIRFLAAELVDFGAAARTEWAEVRFLAELVSAVHDRDGTVIEGDPRRIVESAELWTFERDLDARLPQWRLAATDADE